jgi:hypothetical protein
MLRVHSNTVVGTMYWLSSGFEYPAHQAKQYVDTMRTNGGLLHDHAAAENVEVVAREKAAGVRGEGGADGRHTLIAGAIKGVREIVKLVHTQHAVERTPCGLRCQKH